MSRQKMTDREFAAKVEWEGGVYDAIFDYGLRSTDLADQSTELCASMKALEEILPQVQQLIDSIEEALEEVDE